MRDVKAITSIALVTLSMLACEAKDKVLQPDIVALDGSTDPIDGDGAEDGTPGDGDGDPLPGDGMTGDGDATPGDGDGAGDGTGDGMQGDGDGGGGEHVAKDADCDMNGIWIGRQITRSVALGAGQFANNYYYFEFEHDGEDIVVKNHYDCGIIVRGTVTVNLSRATTEALIGHNLQAGRKGKLYKDGSSCHFEMERFWSLRGASEDMFIPDPRNDTRSVAMIAAENPIPTRTNTAGAEDWENDGSLGSAWQVSGIISGTRNTVQRDWTEYFSDAAHPMAPANDFPNVLTLRARFDSEEQVIAPSSGLITQLSAADVNAEHLLTLKFLGRDASDSRAQGIIKSSKIDTCFAIQAAIPVASSF